MIQALIFALLAVGVGIAFCFLGYRFFRFLLPIWAFFTGIFFGVSLIGTLLGEGFFSTALGLIIGFFLGLLLAALAYFVFSLGIVLFGASVGFSIGQGAMLILGFQEGFISFTVGLIVSLVFAIVFVVWRFPRLFVVFITAFGGAMAIITGLFVLFGQVPAAQESLRLTSAMVTNSVFWTLSWIILGAFGTAIQYGVEKEVDMMEVYVYETATLNDMNNKIEA